MYNLMSECNIIKKFWRAKKSFSFCGTEKSDWAILKGEKWCVNYLNLSVDAFEPPTVWSTGQPAAVNSLDTLFLIIKIIY